MFHISEAKVMIFAHYFGQPEFVKYQALFFEKNMLDDYEFVVFEDSPLPEISAKIEEECRKYHVGYIRIPRSLFDEPLLPLMSDYVSKYSPSFECCIATQYIYTTFAENSKDICLILDNDIFLLSPFSIEKYIGNACFSYVPQHRGVFPHIVTYMLPNFLILQPSSMKEKDALCFNMGEINTSRTDSGGYTYFYLQNFFAFGTPIHRTYLFSIPPNTSIFKDRFEERCPLLFHSEEWGSHFFIQPDTFLHLRMGSNWSRHPHYEQMLAEIDLFFSELITD